MLNEQTKYYKIKIVEVYKNYYLLFVVVVVSLFYFGKNYTTVIEIILFTMSI